jgi:hypothetical protein
VVLPADLVVILPILTIEDFRMEYVLTEPLYVALDIVNKVLSDKKCDIIVSGLGTIGLLTLFLLRKFGFESVDGYNRSKYEWVNGKLLDWGVNKVYHDISDINDKYDIVINTAPYYTVQEFLRKLK